MNLIRTIVDNNNCFFHEIQQENDLGIDAIIELSNNDVISGLNIAVQIKAGTSYINYGKRECSFPIGNHVGYWSSHVLPVYGFVCDIDRQCYYYVDIKNYISIYKDEINAGTIKSITFEIAFFNTITSENFENLFKRPFFQNIPFLTYDDTQKLFASDSPKDVELGLQILRKYYYSLEETWNVFLRVFRDDKYSVFRYKILYFFSVGTHNPDSWFSGEDYKVSSKAAKQIIQSLNREDIILLLQMVDEENGFQRGSIGEWIDFTIQVIPNNINLLTDIVCDADLSMTVRERALFLLACNDTQAFFKIPVTHDFSCYELLKEQINTYGAVNPYM